MATKNNNGFSPEKYIRERARGLEIGKCFITENWEICGMLTAYVTRKHKQGTYIVGMYLVDTYCLGVKDATYLFSIDEDRYHDMIYSGPKFKEVSYNEVHNLIYGALEFAAEAGIKPHKDWSVAKYILEEDDDNIPLIEYEMGKDGKHFLVAKSNLELTTYLPTLKRNLAEGEYDYVIQLGVDDDFFGDDEDEFGEEDEDNEEGDFETLMDRISKYIDEKNKGVNRITEKVEVKVFPHIDMPQLNYPELLNKLSHNPSAKEVKAILNLPKETLRQDLETIVRCHFNTTDGENNHIVRNCVTLLAEVGNEETLSLLLDSLRLSEEFLIYHFCQAIFCCYTGTLVKLAKGNLDVLWSFMHEPGRHFSAHMAIFSALHSAFVVYPEKQKEIIEGLKELLQFYATALPKAKGCDSDTAGEAIGFAVGINAKELTPEIKQLYATGMVSQAFCGKLEDVLADIEKECTPNYQMSVTDIYERFDWLRADY